MKRLRWAVMRRSRATDYAEPLRSGFGTRGHVLRHSLRVIAQFRRSGCLPVIGPQHRPQVVQGVIGRTVRSDAYPVQGRAQSELQGILGDQFCIAQRFEQRIFRASD